MSRLQSRDAHAVVLDSQRFFRGLSASTLQLTSLPHVLAAALGLQQPLAAAHPADADQLTPAKEAQAKRPNAQIIFNVESVGKGASTDGSAQRTELSAPTGLQRRRQCRLPLSSLMSHQSVVRAPRCARCFVFLFCSILVLLQPPSTAST